MDITQNQWIYIDDHGKTQGPFSFQQMQQWYRKKYFKPTLLVKISGSDSEFQPISSIFPSSDSDISTSTNSASVLSLPSSSSSSGSDTTVSLMSSSPSCSSLPQQPLVSPHESTDWLYIDDNNKIQGPFTQAKLIRWCQAGFFKPTIKMKLKAGTEEDHLEKTFVSLQDLPSPYSQLFLSAMPQQIENQQEKHQEQQNEQEKEEQSPDEGLEQHQIDTTEQQNEHEQKMQDEDRLEAIKPVEVVDPASERWYYLDNNETQHGPFGSIQMRTWHRKGWFLFNDCPLKEEREEKFMTLTERGQLWIQQKSSTSSSSLVSPFLIPSFVKIFLPPQHSVEERWFYIDTTGQAQGPFTTIQMKQWWVAGYFQLSTRVRQVGDKPGAFSEIGKRLCSFALADLPPPMPPTNMNKIAAPQFLCADVVHH